MIEMCDHIQKPDGPDGVFILCATTGKPITNELGMFCEDECGKEECKKAKDQGLKLFDLLDDLMG